MQYGSNCRQVSSDVAMRVFSVNLTGPDPYNVSAGWARQIVEQLQATEPVGIKVAPMSLAMGVSSYDRRT